MGLGCGMVPGSVSSRAELVEEGRVRSGEIPAPQSRSVSSSPDKAWVLNDFLNCPPFAALVGIGRDLPGPGSSKLSSG